MRRFGVPFSFCERLKETGGGLATLIKPQLASAMSRLGTETAFVVLARGEGAGGAGEVGYPPRNRPSRTSYAA